MGIEVAKTLKLLQVVSAVLGAFDFSVSIVFCGIATNSDLESVLPEFFGRGKIVALSGFFKTNGLSINLAIEISAEPQIAKLNNAATILLRLKKILLNLLI
jgi:hypothetical protein